MSRDVVRWRENLKQIDRRERSKYFRVVRNGKYFRLVHVPSGGDYVQRYGSDFLTQRDAYACRARIIEAAPEWDWSDPGLFQEMPTNVFDKVWKALYANTTSQKEKKYGI
jgi:hypothetical protein